MYVVDTVELSPVEIAVLVLLEMKACIVTGLNGEWGMGFLGRSEMKEFCRA